MPASPSLDEQRILSKHESATTVRSSGMDSADGILVVPKKNSSARRSSIAQVADTLAELRDSLTIIASRPAVRRMMPPLGKRTRSSSEWDVDPVVDRTASPSTPAGSVIAADVDGNVAAPSSPISSEAQAASEIRQRATDKGVLDDTAVALSVENWRRQLAELRAGQDPLYWNPDSPSAPASPAPAKTRLASSIRRASMAEIRSSDRRKSIFGTPTATSAVHVGRYLGEPAAGHHGRVSEPDTPQTEDARLASSIRRRASDAGLAGDDRLAAAIAQWHNRIAVPIYGDGFQHRAPFEAVGEAPSSATTVTGEVAIDIDKPTSLSGLQLKKSASGGRRFSLKFDAAAFLAGARRDGQSSDDGGSESERERRGGRTGKRGSIIGYVTDKLNMRGSASRTPFQTVEEGPISPRSLATVSSRIIWDNKTGSARFCIGSPVTSPSSPTADSRSPGEVAYFADIEPEAAGSKRRHRSHKQERLHVATDLAPAFPAPPSRPIRPQYAALLTSMPSADAIVFVSSAMSAMKRGVERDVQRRLRTLDEQIGLAWAARDRAEALAAAAEERADLVQARFGMARLSVNWHEQSKQASQPSIPRAVEDAAPQFEQQLHAESSSADSRSLPFAQWEDDAQDCRLESASSIEETSIEQTGDGPMAWI
jgi:hypothetical protein